MIGTAWRKYPNLRAWVVGRIMFRGSALGLPTSRLAKVPGYLLGTELDVDDALRELRNAGVIIAMGRRWYIRNKAEAWKIGKPLQRAARAANDA